MRMFFHTQCKHAQKHQVTWLQKIVEFSVKAAMRNLISRSISNKERSCARVRVYMCCCDRLDAHSELNFSLHANVPHRVLCHLTVDFHFATGVLSACWTSWAASRSSCFPACTSTTLSASTSGCSDPSRAQRAWTRLSTVCRSSACSLLPPPSRKRSEA